MFMEKKDNEYILPKSHHNASAGFAAVQLENLNLIYVIQQENLWYEYLDPSNVRVFVAAFVTLIVLKSLLFLLMENPLVSSQMHIINSEV